MKTLLAVTAYKGHTSEAHDVLDLCTRWIVAVCFLFWTLFLDELGSCLGRFVHPRVGRVGNEKQSS